MSKLTLKDLSNLQNENTAVANINANNAAIEAAIDNTISRDGETPNQMEAELDMNSNHIINLPGAASDFEPIRRKEFLEAINALETSDGIADGTLGNNLLADMPADTVKARLDTSGEPQDVPIQDIFDEYVPIVDVPVRSTITALPALASDMNSFLALGITNPGDTVPAPYVSRLNEPSHAGKVFRDGQWWELIRNDGVYIEDFGAVNALDEATGNIVLTHDCTPALNDAINYCYIKRKGLVRINSGIWGCNTQPDPIPVGITLSGHGSSSSSRQGGSSLYMNYNESTPANAFLHWDGSGQQFNATGGGILNMNVRKGPAKTGGTLILLTGVDDANRPGYMSFLNLIVSGTNQGANCDYCIIQDGSNLTTVNANGIRDVTWVNLFVDGWVQDGMQLVNATHGKLFGLNASPTGSSLNCLRITGLTSDPTSKTTSFMGAGIECYGTLIVDNANYVNLQARATDLVVTGNTTNSLIQAVVENIPTYTGTIGGVPTTRDLLQRINRTTIQDGRDDALYTGSGLQQVVGSRITGITEPTGSTYEGAWDTQQFDSLDDLTTIGQILKSHDNVMRTHGLISD